LKQDLALIAGGVVAAWGSLQPPVPVTASNVVMMAAATNYYLSVTATGNLLAWGSGGLTNAPFSASNLTAVAAGNLHGLAAVDFGASPRLLGRISHRSEASAGQALPFFARAVGGQPLHYSWLADGVPILNADSPFPQLPATLGNDSVNYQVVV